MRSRSKRHCRRCGTLVRKETNKGLRKEYPFYCPTCDENMFRFETIKKCASVKNTKNDSIMKCQDCGKECFDDKYPEVVFKDEHHCICENCSIDYYEDTNGKIRLREIF